MATHAQRTLSAALKFNGIGLHSGHACTMSLLPARQDAGINFFIGGNSLRASFDNVVGTELCTTLSTATAAGDVVHTVEHLLSAMAAFRVDNAEVHLTAPEVPIMDGSALAFVHAFRENVVDIPTSRRRKVLVKQTVSVMSEPTGPQHTSTQSATLHPADGQGLILDVSIDFGSRIRSGAGSVQRVIFDVRKDDYESIASARTFGFEQDVDKMQAQGKAMGGSLENAVLFDRDGYCVNPDGLRFEDEPCRHKVLDCIGDLSLAGDIVAHYVGDRPGHTLNNLLLRKLFSSTANYTIVASS